MRYLGPFTLGEARNESAYSAGFVIGGPPCIQILCKFS